MAVRANNGRHGSVLERGIAQLILNQAQLVALQVQLAAQHAIWEKESIRLQKAADERFERIETLLLQHDRMLRDLPEAIRKKIGYQPK
jgi:hypothetical protein